MEKNKNIWYATRACFWAMVCFWVLASLVLAVDEGIVGLLLSMIACGFVIATFVLSILHLRRYKEKGLAVTAIVISSLGIFIMFFGFMEGLLVG